MREDASSTFLLDFDPTKPRREKQRASKQRYTAGESTKKNTPPTAVFNEKGVHLRSGKDVCDCLLPDCPGCHFPCTKCKSTKCGHECRQKRKWEYKSITYENTPEKNRTNYLDDIMSKKS